MSILLKILAKTKIFLFKLSAFVIILSTIVAYNENVTATTTPTAIISTTTETAFQNDTIIAARKEKIHHQYERMIESFDEYKQFYRKQYRRRFREERSRQAFEENLNAIKKHNAEFVEGKHTFKMRPTSFADFSNSEYQKRFVRLRKSEYNPDLDGERLTSFNVNDKTIPDSFDWRERGFDTAAENQKTCGSCYAYSIAYTVMGQIHKRVGQVVPLSWQQIVDCSQPYGNQGCQGGSLRITLKYLEKCGGVMREQDYPYTATQGRCKFRSEMVVANISSWAILPPKDELSLRAAVYQVGPVAISINAALQSFQLYSEGIYNDEACTSKTVNHAMVVIGYTPDYWIIKNWWGLNWGEKGYMRIKRGANLCGLANYAAYSVI